MYIITYILLFFLVFYGVKKTCLKNDNIVVEAHKNLNELRGVFAIIIILSHFTIIFDKIPLILIPFSKISTLCVGYFFAMSGYGLAYSYYNKNNYLNNFILKKIIYLVFVVLISFLFSGITLIVFRKLCDVNINLALPNWYIYSLMMFYILYYLSYKVFKGRYKALCLTILTIIITLLALKFNLPRTYFISQWSFPLGALIYEYKDKIDWLIKNRLKNIILVLAVILLISLYSFFVKEYTILDLILHNLLFLPFYFTIILICYFFRFYNNIIKFLKTISFELYIYQFIVMNIVTSFYQKYNLERGIIYLFYVLALDIIVSVFFNKFNKYFINKLSRTLVKGRKLND